MEWVNLTGGGLLWASDRKRGERGSKPTMVHPSLVNRQDREPTWLVPMSGSKPGSRCNGSSPLDVRVIGKYEQQLERGSPRTATKLTWINFRAGKAVSSVHFCRPGRRSFSGLVPAGCRGTSGSTAQETRRASDAEKPAWLMSPRGTDAIYRILPMRRIDALH